MKTPLHAVGRTRDVLAYLSVGAEVHEVVSIEEAKNAVHESALAGGTVIVSEEFAAAAEGAEGGLVIVVPGVGAAKHTALEKTRELITRSIGVDLIAKAQRTGSE